jgi:putative oxidoreductase
MKIVKLLPAFIIAFLFLFSSAVYFFKFIPTPPMEGDIAIFNKLFGDSGYMAMIKVLEIITAILLILPKTRALGYVFAMPIVLNILFMEIFIAKQPGIGIVLVILAGIGLYLNKEKFESILL